MRFPSTPISKAAVLYGLLAITQAHPAIFSSQNDKYRELNRRMNSPTHPSSPKVGHVTPITTPHVEQSPPSPRLTADAPDPAIARQIRLDAIKVKGTRNRLGLEQKLDSVTPATGKGFDEYNAKIKDYYVPEADPFQVSMTSNEVVILKNKGQIKISKTEPGTDMLNAKIYGAKEEVVNSGNLEPIFEARVDPNQKLMIREHAYRNGDGNMDKSEVDAMYPGIAEADRIFMSEHIAKTWANLGGGKPMERNLARQVANLDMEPLLKRLAGEGQFGAVIKPDHPEWDTLLGGSVGAPLVRALRDHPDVFHHYEIQSAVVYKGETLPAVLFKLGPRVRSS